MDFGSESIFPVTISSDQDSFERGAAFDDLDIRVRSRPFRGGKLTAMMCEVTVDLREAELGPEGATISVQSALSGIYILVPCDWDVDCVVDAVFGGVEGERLPPASSKRGPRLRLTGMVVAGGLCVR